MEICKYILPCGYCDKYDMPCKATEKDTEIKNTFNCDHDWHYEGTGFGNSSSAYERYRCTKCGMFKEVKVIEL